MSVTAAFQCRLEGFITPSEGPMKGILLARFTYLEGPNRGREFALKASDARDSSGKPLTVGDTFSLSDLHQAN